MPAISGCHSPSNSSGSLHERVTKTCHCRVPTPDLRRNQENKLTIRGARQPKEKTSDVLYLGIAARAFERSFQLADHVVVEGANLDNGLLHVELVREVPEAMKPRIIPITSPSTLLEATPAQLAA